MTFFQTDMMNYRAPHWSVYTPAGKFQQSLAWWCPAVARSWKTHVLVHRWQSGQAACFILHVKELTAELLQMSSKGRSRRNTNSSSPNHYNSSEPSWMRTAVSIPMWVWLREGLLRVCGGVTIKLQSGVKHFDNGVDEKQQGSDAELVVQAGQH